MAGEPLVTEALEEYEKHKMARLDKNLLRPFLPMAILRWLIRELPRVDPKLGERLLRAVCERCAFDDDQVWEVPR